MKVEVVPASAVAPEVAEAWRLLQAPDATLRSPFFSPEFAAAVGRHRPESRVALIEQGGRLAGVFAFHRKRWRVGAPIAGQMSDYHGLVAAPDLALDGGRLLRAARLDAFDFNHAPASQPIFAGAAYRGWSSPALDLGRGVEAWAAHRAAENTLLKRLSRLARKIERDIGPLRLDLDTRAPAIWETLVRWKAAALAVQGVRATFEVPWMNAILADIRDCDGDAFAGMLTALYAGDRLVAVHFGMRTRRVLHWWFPTYDAALAKYSPGLLMLLETARAAEATEIDWIDLGRGAQDYKLRFANAATPLCEGALGRRPSLAGGVRRLRRPLHRLAEAALPPRAADLQRRAANKLLRAGVI